MTKQRLDVLQHFDDAYSALRIGLAEYCKLLIDRLRCCHRKA